MEMSEILRRIADFLKEITPFIETLDVLAFVGIIMSILSATRRKAYEIMIEHRLNSLDRVREDMSRLLYWFSIEGINDYKSKNDDINAYNSDIRKLICSLRTQIKPLYKQEIELCNIIDTARESSNKYFLTPNDDDKKILTDTTLMLQDKYDLYDWTLWLYVQKLHKPLISKTILFDRTYKKVNKEKIKAYKKLTKEKN